MIRAKVQIVTAKKTYRPGEVISEKLSDADMAFLSKRNFIITDEDIASFVDDKEPENETNIEGINTDFIVDGSDGITYKDKEALVKMQKDEIVTYAKSLGLTLNVSLLKQDLIDEVLNYVEEALAAEE